MTGPSPSSKTKKIHVDPESLEHAFKEFEVENEFKNDHAFEDEKNSSTTIRKVEGRSNSSITITPSKSSKAKASSMTPKSKVGLTIQRRPSRRLVEQFKNDHAFEEFEEDNKFKDDHAFEEFKNKFKDDNAFEGFEFQANRVQKFVQLIFNHYKRSQADPV